MHRLNVLISGAGIAGCTLAYWLARYGHSATVVERSGALRSSGAPVDVRGPAAEIAKRMGIVPRLREASTRISGLSVLDWEGRLSGQVDLEALRRSIAPQESSRAATSRLSCMSPLALLIFWHPEMSDFDPADDDQHKRILETTFAGIGWKVPEILKAVRATSDLYFDSVSKVQLTTWTRGRIALLGDASSCVSRFGDGSTLAITGAHTLATALAENSADHDAASRQYQAQHGKLVRPKQKNLSLIASILVPKTQLGIAVRDRALGILRLYAAIKGWVP